MTGLVVRAKEFAKEKHDDNPIVERRFRKYTKKPYWTHCERVANTLTMVGMKPEVVAAAWLHDLVEDCPVTSEEIEKLFGTKVARLVAEVTNPSKLIDGTRAVRKSVEKRRDWQRFCSNACRMKWHNKRRKEVWDEFVAKQKRGQEGTAGKSQGTAEPSIYQSVEGRSGLGGD